MKSKKSKHPMFPPLIALNDAIGDLTAGHLKIIKRIALEASVGMRKDALYEPMDYLRKILEITKESGYDIDKEMRKLAP